MGMKNENIVRILLLSIGAFLVFIGLFGGIIASGDFLSGGFSVVVGILFLSFSHKMKEIIKEQTIEKNEDATIQNPDKENVIENKIDIDDLIKKSVNITGPTPPSKSKKADKKSPTYIKARKLVDDYVVIDFETTGLSPLDSEILQIGAIKYESNEEIDRIYQNIKPFRSNISKRITKITGLELEDVVNMPTFEDFSPQLMSFISCYTLVAHNAPFDLKFLLHQLNENNIELNQRIRVIDTLPLARRHFETPNHKLITLKDYLNLDNNSHDSLEDCLVTNKVYQYIKHENNKIVQVSN